MNIPRWRFLIKPSFQSVLKSQSVQKAREVQREIAVTESLSWRIAIKWAPINPNIQEVSPSKHQLLTIFKHLLICHPSLLSPCTTQFTTSNLASPSHITNECIAALIISTIWAIDRASTTQAEEVTMTLFIHHWISLQIIRTNRDSKCSWIISLSRCHLVKKSRK